MSLANISIVGNTVKAPEQTVFASGKTKTTIIVAVNSPRRPTDNQQAKDHADFYKVELWGPQGELAHKHIAKGNQIGVSGRLVLDQWTDRSGRARITPVIKADQISLPPRLRLVPSNETSQESNLHEPSYRESEYRESTAPAQMQAERMESIETFDSMLDGVETMETVMDSDVQGGDSGVTNPVTGTMSFEYDPFEGFKDEVLPPAISQVHEEPVAYKPARKRAASRY
jgi:single-strand DNA-binding protein